MENKRDYEALIRELLTGAKVGWSYERFQCWLSSNKLEERELTQWLRKSGAALCGETKIRTQLKSLAILGWGELAQAASKILHYEGNARQREDRWDSQSYYDDALNCYHNALKILACENSPELHFKISIDIARVYFAKSNTPVAYQFQSEAVDILKNIFTDRSTANHKKESLLQYDPFHQLDEDLEICLHLPDLTDNRE